MNWKMMQRWRWNPRLEVRPMGPGSWPALTVAKANDRWWGALLAAAAAATCYLGVEHFQEAKIKSKPLPWDFLPLMITILSSRAVCVDSTLNRCTGWNKGQSSSADSNICQKRLFPIWPHSSIEDFLILMWACCCWYVTGSLADFVSPPELLLDISVRVSIWACWDLLLLHLCVCVLPLTFYTVNQIWRSAFYINTEISTFLLAKRRSALAEHRLYG